MNQGVCQAVKTLEKSNSKQARVRILERRHARLFFVRVSRTLLSSQYPSQHHRLTVSSKAVFMSILTSYKFDERDSSVPLVFEVVCLLLLCLRLLFLSEVMLSCCWTRRSHIWNQHRQHAEGLPNHCIFDRIDRIEYATRSRFLEAIHGDVNAASDNGGPA